MNYLCVASCVFFSAMARVGKGSVVRTGKLKKLFKREVPNSLARGAFFLLPSLFRQNPVNQKKNLFQIHAHQNYGNEG